MREAILQVDSFELLWTMSRMFPHMLISGTTSLSDCTQTLERPVSHITWWTRENTPLDGILLLEKCLYYSSTATMNCHHKIHVTVFSVGKHKQHFCYISQLPVTMKTVKYEVAVWTHFAWLATHGWTCTVCGYRTTLNGYSKWNCKKITFFSRHYLHNYSTLDIGVFGYINVV
jgi:hypothetical protein